jgi:hypothetical protein
MYQCSILADSMRNIVAVRLNVRMRTTGPLTARAQRYGGNGIQELIAAFVSMREQAAVDGVQATPAFLAHTKPDDVVSCVLSHKCVIDEVCNDSA